MLLEKRSAITTRQLAARKWLEEFAEKTKRQLSPQSEIERALAVICLTHKTSDYLAEHDPQGLKQAQKALAGDSWEDFLNPKEKYPNTW